MAFSEQEFANMITEMAETPKWTLRPWRSTVEKQLNSWSMYVPGQSNTPEMLEMKRFKGAIAVFCLFLHYI